MHFAFSVLHFGSLIYIKPQSGSLYIHSSSEPSNDEAEFDKKRVDMWLNHYDLERVQSHCSGHSKGQDLLDVVTTVDAKMLYPIHTEHPDAYNKVAKNMTIVQEGKKYVI